MDNPQSSRELTFGEKAAGVSFNPGGHEDVNIIKAKFAEIIDFCNEKRAEPTATAGAKRYYSTAITNAETAQMFAVKAITWQHD